MKALALALAALTFALPAAAQDAPGPCDRACLKAAADAYVAAMAAHDPAKAPLAPGIVTVENLAKIKPGEGLWKTLTAAPADFRIYVPDVVAQQIGLIAMLEREGKSIEVGIRLKLKDGRIAEAEHVIAAINGPPGADNLKKPRAPFLAEVPYDYRDSRGRLLLIAASYYDALDENNGSLAPFSEDCARRENGTPTVRMSPPDDSTNAWVNIFGVMGCKQQLDSGVMSYIDSIDNRRVWIADPETGLAFGLSHFRHAMVKKDFRVFGVPGMTTWKIDFKPFDLPAVHIFKIWGGQIHQMEAMGYITGYGSKTGWE